MSPFEFHHCVSFASSDIAPLAGRQAQSPWVPEALNGASSVGLKGSYHPRQIGILCIVNEAGGPLICWQSCFTTEPVPLGDGETVTILNQDGTTILQRPFAEIGLKELAEFGLGHYWVRELAVFADAKCWSLTLPELESLADAQRTSGWLERCRAFHAPKDARANQKNRRRFVVTTAHASRLPLTYPYLAFAAAAFPQDPVLTRPDTQMFSILDEARELLLQQRLGDFSTAEILRFSVGHYWVAT